jgi:carbonic anhydrase
VSPEEALQKLLDGNRRYATHHAAHPDETIARRLAIAAGQQPFAAILGCADSRVPPEIIFDEGLGDLFTVRVAGNIMDSAVLASLEYAAVELGVPLVMVLGHEGCGAVKAALAVKSQGTSVPGHVTTLVRALSPAISEVDDTSDAAVAQAVRANVTLVAAKIGAAQPVIAPLVGGGKLAVVGAQYNLHDGLVELIPG